MERLQRASQSLTICLKKITTALLVLAVLAPGVSWAKKYPPYYGVEFENLIESSQNPAEIRIASYRLLTWYHQPRNESQGDLIVQNCSSNYCYRHESIGYNEARKALLGNLYLVDHGGQYGVVDFYCDRVVPESEFKSQPPRPNQIPDHSVVNIEHSWPQSRFTGRHPKDYQKSDLHHLFPSDSELNSSRGSLPFGDVVTPKRLKCDSSKLGHGEDHSFVFEPPVEHKGNFARALFYFSVRYQIPIDEDQEAALRRWHEQDPVDQEEVERNEFIYSMQGNRNPFIDIPELVYKISDF